MVTLQAEYENKLYEELKTGITVAITWNKYRAQIVNQSATNTFNNVDRLFVLAFESNEDRSSFRSMPSVEIKEKYTNQLLN